jgi:MoxR-like ATPase
MVWYVLGALAAALVVACVASRHGDAVARDDTPNPSEAAPCVPKHDALEVRVNPAVASLYDTLTKAIVGQREGVESVLLGLIAGGHVLLEGPPGVAKTMLCRTLASALDARYRRIQFTPDLLVSDIAGTTIYDQRSGSFSTQLGPVFANIVLADEINRAPARVQSALLQAMEEREVTIAQRTYRLPDEFMVLATMNPWDPDGTFSLPEAQLDRFLLKARLRYPAPHEELSIVRRGSDGSSANGAVATLADVRGWQAAAQRVHLSDDIARAIVAVVGRTRIPSEYVQRGAGPRASLALARVARARAFLFARDAVREEDVRAAAPAVLRHRMSFTHRAIIEAIAAEVG